MISVSADVLLRTNLQRVTEISLTIICILKDWQLSRVDLRKTMWNDPDKEGYWVNPDGQFLMNYFFLNKPNKVKNIVRYDTVASTSGRRIEQIERDGDHSWATRKEATPVQRFASSTNPIYTSLECYNWIKFDYFYNRLMLLFRGWRSRKRFILLATRVCMEEAAPRGKHLASGLSCNAVTDNDIRLNVNWISTKKNDRTNFYLNQNNKIVSAIIVAIYLRTLRICSRQYLREEYKFEIPSISQVFHTGTRREHMESNKRKKEKKITHPQ